MKLRAVRCHQTGLSNRSQYDDKSLNSSQRAYSLMDSSKFTNMNKTAAGQTFKSTTGTINKKYSTSFRESLKMHNSNNPLGKTNIFTNQQRNIESIYNGEDMQLQSKKFDTANFRQNQFALSYDGAKPVPTLIEPLEATLNKEVKNIRNHFEGKDINMHKLKEIKRAFLQNFADKNHIKPYYEKYARSDGKIDRNGFKSLVKDFGFYATDDEIGLMLSLTKNKIDNGNQASIQDFITLTSKPNIYFQTLKLQDHKHLQQKPRIFTKKVHLLLRNAFLRLRQAMHIYDQQSIPLTQPQFHKVFKKLDLTDLVISKKQIDDLFYQFKNQNGTVNQEKLLGAIAEQENLNIMMKKRPVEVEFQDNLTRHKEIKEMVDSKKGVTDLRNMSNADYERQMRRVRSMVADVRKVWKDKREFEKLIRKEEKTTSRNELRENIEKVMQNAGLNYSKKDYDALMACFKYNVNGGTKFDDIVTTLYDESQQAFDDRMDRRCRNLPPNLSSDNPSQFPTDLTDPILQQGLSKIDTKLLHNEFVKTFKGMDTDKDGYVSIQDFQNAMQKKQILTNQQMSSVVNYLDQDGKGYLTFQEIQEKLHPNIVNEIKKTSLPTLLSKFNTTTKQKWLDSKRTFIASTNKYEYSLPSKYSAWPKHLTTTDLSLLQPNDTSAMHQTQRDRFNLRQKDSYGAEDKRRAQSINDSKVQKKSMWESNLQQRIEHNREDEFRKEQQVNHLKRLAQEIYERNCHKQQ